jgi:hypothetical protein
MLAEEGGGESVDLSRDDYLIAIGVHPGDHFAILVPSKIRPRHR